MIIPGQKRLVVMALFWNWLLGFFSWNVFAQVQPDCDFQYYLQFGQQEILQNPGFEQGYGYAQNKICRWTYRAPAGLVFDVTCNPIDIPGKTSNNQCQTDRLVVSLTGNPTFSDGRNFCGQGSFKLTSVSNALTIGLVSAPNSPGGRYRCVISPLVSGGVPPTSTTTSTTTPRPNNCDCGWRQQRRIVGGQETKVNEFAFMAAIVDNERRVLWCGATIISNRYVVTAAHCLRDESTYSVLVGDHNYKVGYETTSAQLYQVEYYRRHQYYNNDTQQFDIALVKTDKDIVFSVNVGPICLPYRYTDVDFTGADVTALGWGSIYFSGPTSDSLQSVNLSVVDRGTCQQYYTPPKETISTGQLCTYAPGKDACTYDSGGPIIWFDKFNTYRYQFLGIISYGKACATNTPGVNTRVSSQLSWILNETPDAYYCFK